ncbi:MAG TPA: iron ABC transporter permease, partial [Thermoanaerobaculia bacterium]
MSHVSRRGLPAAIIVFLVVNLLAIVIALAFGAVDIRWSDLFERNETALTIVLRIRLPRVVLAGLVGATLAVAGLTFQTLLRNPLADPFILGVSGGAACGAAVTTALGLGRYPGVVSLASFAGACAAIAGVLLLAQRRRHVEPARLILAGLVLNAFFTALILISLAMIRGSDLAAALRWMMGTFFSATWNDVALLAMVLLLSYLLLRFIASDLRLLAFGEDDARSRGVDTERVKLAAFIVGSLATGAAVAVSGIIGFVG